MFDPEGPDAVIDELRDELAACQQQRDKLLAYLEEAEQYCPPELGAAIQVFLSKIERNK